MPPTLGASPHDTALPPRLLPSLARLICDFVRFTGVWRTLTVTAAMVASAALEATMLVLLIPMLALTIRPAGGRVHAAVRSVFDVLGLYQPTSRLLALFTIFALVLILRVVIAGARDTMFVAQQTAFTEAQSKRVVRSLAETHWSAIARLRQARVTHALATDIIHIRQAIRLLQSAIVGLLLLLGQCAAAAVLSLPLAIVCGVLLTAGASVLLWTMRKAQALGERTTQANLKIADSAAQFLGGLKLALSQGLQHGYVADMETVLHRISADQISYARQQALMQLLFTALATALGVAICGIGLSLLSVAPATLVGFLVILVRMIGPATNLRQNAQLLAQVLPAYGSLRALVDELPPGSPSVAGSAAHPLGFGAIAFEKVGYAHRNARGEARGGLSGFSATIAAGEFVGIAGPSGAGKTTLVDLLVGLYAPDTGSIRIDGQTLNTAMVGAWRRSLSYVAQDAYLLHGTVRHNLLWANPAASEDALWNALRIAGADAVVTAMSAGLDTVVGERGGLLSGGERQRIAIARAIVRQPKLLILDEATNAIGVEAERQLLDRLRGLDPRPTILLVAHRQESLAACDRVITLDGGE